MSFIFLWCHEAVSKQQVSFKNQESNFINAQNVETVLEMQVLSHMCVLEWFRRFIEGLDYLEDDRESMQLCLLTPWSRVLLEKLTGFAANQEIPTFYGTRKFVTILTSACHLSLP